MYYHQVKHTFVLGLIVGFFEGSGVGGDVGCRKRRGTKYCYCMRCEQLREYHSEK